MKLPLYQVDAFTDRRFHGNPAAICPLEQWLPDSVLQAIAAENNLSGDGVLRSRTTRRRRPPSPALVYSWR